MGDFTIGRACKSIILDSAWLCLTPPGSAWFRLVPPGSAWSLFRNSSEIRLAEEVSHLITHGGGKVGIDTDSYSYS